MKKLSLLALSLASAGAFAQFVDRELVVAVQPTTGTGDAAVTAIDKSTGASGFSAALTGFRVTTSTAGGGIKTDINGNIYLPGTVSTSTTSPRAARVSTTGSVGLALLTGTQAPRGLAPLNTPGSFYVSALTGNSSGVVQTTATFDNATAMGTSTLVGTAANSRIVTSFGDSPFVTRASTTATSHGIFQNGTSTQVATANTPATTGLTDLWISFDGLTAYATDERTTADGGVVKYTRASTSANFSLAYVLSTATGAATTGARFLAVDEVTPGNFTIYAATAEADNNRLVKIVDTGASSSASLLTNAGAGNSFRGVGVVPEPASMIAIGVGLAGLASRRRKNSN